MRSARSLMCNGKVFVRYFYFYNFLNFPRSLRCLCDCSVSAFAQTDTNGRQISFVIYFCAPMLLCFPYSYVEHFMIECCFQHLLSTVHATVAKIIIDKKNCSKTKQLIKGVIKMNINCESSGESSGIWWKKSNTFNGGEYGCGDGRNYINDKWKCVALACTRHERRVLTAIRQVIIRM